ncbi:hypothetical protein NDU88_007627 [Pleurodeles waltl]|uniref:Uncharacterized protein n=1 Tax=Pleurodeles waltl TaxID=8319 RepID=A0AAV7QNL4_PLEWA|nr:hypothetical protein NDU88_007627 [Pleurodeles waltl]
MTVRFAPLKLQLGMGLVRLAHGFHNRRGLHAPRLSTPARARRAALPGPQRRYEAASHSPANPLRRSPLGHSVYLSPAWGAPSLVLICPEPHLRALSAIAGFVAPFNHDLPQHLAQHSTRTLCSPLHGCFTSPRHSAQADSTLTRAPHAPVPAGPRWASLFRSGCCLARLSAKCGSSPTFLIFRPSGAPKYSVSNGFGLQDCKAAGGASLWHSHLAAGQPPPQFPPFCMLWWMVISHFLFDGTLSKVSKSIQNIRTVSSGKKMFNYIGTSYELHDIPPFSDGKELLQGL